MASDVMAEMIVLADGTSFPGSLGVQGSTLWIWFTGAADNQGMIDLVTAFADPEKTGTIRYVGSGSSEIVVTGYTRMTDIKSDNEMNQTSIRLRKQEGEG